MNFFFLFSAPVRRVRAQASTFVLVAIVVLFVLVFGLNIGKFGTFPPQYPVYLFLGLIMFVLAFMRTDFALVLLILSMLLSPEIGLGRLSDRTITIRLDDILIIVIFLGWLAKLAVFKELGLLKRTPLNGPIFLYVFVCILSTGMMLISGQGSFSRSFFYFLKYFEYFLLYFLVVNNINEMRQVRFFLLLMIFTCFVVSCYGLYSYFIGGFRATAPFEGEGGEANTLAGYLILMLALVISILLHNGLPRYRIQLLGVLGMGSLAFLFTLSRGGWLGFIVMCVMMAFYCRKNRAVLVFFLIFFTVLAPFAAPRAVRERVRTTFASGRTYKVVGRKVTIDMSGEARIESWRIGWRKLMEKPVLGHGIPGGSVVDNQYTRVMTEVGLVGLLVFLFLLFRIHRACRRAEEVTRGHPLGQSVAVGFAAAFVGLLAHALSAATFIIIRIMEPFWFIVAIIVLLPDLIGPASAAEPVCVEGT